jgi:hypothetical protein
LARPRRRGRHASAGALQHQRHHIAGDEDPVKPTGWEAREGWREMVDPAERQWSVRATLLSAS